MAKDPVMPKGNGFTTGNEKNVTSGKSHKAPPVSGQMKLGKAHCLADRKGTFKGKASDLRSEQGSTRFSKGTRLAKADMAGGQKGQGHTGQPSGHKGMVKGMKG